MFEHGFLARLQTQEAYRALSNDERCGQIKESVLSHLRQLFQVRQGSNPFLEGYGVPDFNDLVYQFPDAIVHIGAAIRKLIDQYEPRLSRVRVNYLPAYDDPLRLRFSIEAMLSGQRGEFPVRFRTVMTSAGQTFIEQ